MFVAISWYPAHSNCPWEAQVFVDMTLAIKITNFKIFLMKCIFLLFFYFHAEIISHFMIHKGGKMRGRAI